MSRVVQGINLQLNFHQIRNRRGCQSAHRTEILKIPHFQERIISAVLRDFPFSRNNALKSADDWQIGILKNKVEKLRTS
jgi:hypothetical protein